MTELVLTGAVLLTLAGAGAAWYFRRKRDQARREAELLRRHADRLTLQLLAAEQCVGHLTATVIPAAVGAAQDGDGARATLMVPPNLEGTPLAERLRTLPGAVAAAVEDVRARERAAAAQSVEQLRQDAERQIAQARHESVGVARAAVRGFANNVVARAARLGRAVSQGVRRHISDEAYATLVEIDHLAQQMLLTASGYAVLAGDKLSRRWPATAMTDIVRAAMGRIEGYERIKHPEMGSISVEGRAVEAVVHALAVLLDNALRYSPPAASVHVSLEQGHHACFLIVDDAGLRMDDERLLWAGDVMSGEQRDDITRLGAHPQTGLRVASLLAENYGFRVELTAPNIYQGTRAMIVLPKNLLITPESGGPAVASVPSVPAARTEPPAVPPAPAAAPLPSGAHEAVPAAPAVPAAEPAPAAAPTAVPAATAHQAPQAPPATPAAGRTPPATTASGLTVRRRNPALAAQRRTTPPPAAAGPGRPAIAAAWAEGTRRGRLDDPSPTPAEHDAAYRTAPGTGHDAAHEEGH
ncbi:ATP-binding protein [Streptomyces sp. NPDC018947]|uniref:ATP-binding protein n=1 Tax=Streptomyces sp. NPDC018947 TaxID=3365054 RepID=UPI0037B312EA